MQINKTSKRVLTGAAVMGTSLAIIGGIAIAYWTSTGSGTGAVASYTAKALILSPPASASVQPLYPGSSPVAVNMLISNPNPYPVALASIVAGSVAGVTKADGTATTCAASTGVLPSGLPTSTATPQPAGAVYQAAPAATVAANASASPISFPAILSMATAASDACQGVVYTLNLNVTGTQTN